MVSNVQNANNKKPFIDRLNIQQPLWGDGVGCQKISGLSFPVFSGVSCWGVGQKKQQRRVDVYWLLINGLPYAYVIIFIILKTFSEIFVEIFRPKISFGCFR